MPADRPELGLADVRRRDDLVPAPVMLCVPEVLNQPLEARALRMEADEAGASFFVDAEKVELLANLPMIAALCLFETHLLLALSLLNGFSGFSLCSFNGVAARLFCIPNTLLFSSGC